MKVLIVKLSSLGDVIHTFPALTDAAKALSNIRFDWVIEEAFQEVPTWHPAVNRVIPVGLRRLKKARWYSRQIFQQSLPNIWRELRREKYDAIIDAQGLLKSAAIATIAKGPVAGFSWSSAREPLANLAYRQHQRIARTQHAIPRLRQLFAQSLHYTFNATAVDYGINLLLALSSQPALPSTPQPSSATTVARPIIFLHGTTWTTKHWPVEHWCELGKLFGAQHDTVLVPWGNEVEHQRALKIAAAHPAIKVLPKCSLTEIAQHLATARACVAMDTGLGHLAAALGVPTVTIYGPTDPAKTGTVGANQQHLASSLPCAPCLARQCRYVNAKKSSSDMVLPPAAFQLWGESQVQAPCLNLLSPTGVFQSIKNLIGPGLS